MRLFKPFEALAHDGAAGVGSIENGVDEAGADALKLYHFQSLNCATFHVYSYTGAASHCVPECRSEKEKGMRELIVGEARK